VLPRVPHNVSIITINQGTFREHPGPIEGTSREYPGPIQGTFSERSEPMEGTLRCRYLELIEQLLVFADVEGAAAGQAVKVEGAAAVVRPNALHV